VKIKAGAWDVPAVFEVIAREGDVSFEEMHRVFNMGIGMVVFTAPEHVATIGRLWRERGQRWYAIGNVGREQERVTIEPPPSGDVPNLTVR
jgi:phosphoribosylformylglycinamidine cyclo-ligase